MPKAIVAALLAIATLAMLSLSSGMPYLETLLPGGLPLGNALAALGLCAAAAAAFGLSARSTVLRAVSLAALFSAAAWLPVSIALAGNVALNFSGDRGAVWLVISLGVVAGVFVVLVWAVLAALLARRSAKTLRGSASCR